MKLLFIFLSSVVLSQNSGSQTQATGAIPQNIVSAFSIKYTGAHVITWKTGDNDYEASFKLSGKKYRAFYSTGGEWQKTERKIRWPRQLPATIKRSLKTGAYAAWYIDEAKEVNTPGGQMYFVHVDDANVLTITDAYLFKDEYQLCYNEKGELVKTEKLP